VQSSAVVTLGFGRVDDDCSGEEGEEEIEERGESVVVGTGCGGSDIWCCLEDERECDLDLLFLRGFLFFLRGIFVCDVLITSDDVLVCVEVVVDVVVVDVSWSSMLSSTKLPSPSVLLLESRLGPPEDELSSLISSPLSSPWSSLRIPSTTTCSSPMPLSNLCCSLLLFVVSTSFSFTDPCSTSIMDSHNTCESLMEQGSTRGKDTPLRRCTSFPLPVYGSRCVGLAVGGNFGVAKII